MSEAKVETNVDGDENLTSHNYDGIQEYDNPLPGWWKNLFIGTFVFSFVYWMFFHAGQEGRTIEAQYGREMSARMVQRFQEIGDLEPNRETILKYMNDEKWLPVGKTVYDMNCVSCHGANGGGNVGPNLTDKNWKNVKTVEDIARVISKGAANGAMPAWENRLSHQNLIVLTAAYIATLNKTPVDGKPPEGNNIVTSWTE
ncbi:MAG: cbb3-type cytochrome c oxidase N-terminal domain-containing protein [Pirellulaceae bacterium]